MIEFLKKVYSKTDNTIKYIFKYDDKYKIEFSYIDKNDGKNIICVPCQTICSMGCKFCHTNDYIGKIYEENITHDSITEGVNYIFNDMLLDSSKELLVSFMGCGEPMKNHKQVLNSIVDLTDIFGYKNIRFAVSTLLPRNMISTFISFAEIVKDLKLNVKVHLSLHHVNNKKRTEMMPNCSKIGESISALELYREMTGNRVEIHYTLIDKVNDSAIDFAILADMFYNKGICLKFLHYNKKDSVDYKISKSFDDNKNILDDQNIEYEYYKPPGLDIGASCGQFLMEV